MRLREGGLDGKKTVLLRRKEERGVCLCVAQHPYEGGEGRLTLLHEEYVQLLQTCQGGWGRGRKVTVFSSTTLLSSSSSSSSCVCTISMLFVVC